MYVKASAERPTVYDVPVSNNGARVRFVLYKKGLESMYDLKPPTAIGGLQVSNEFLINRQCQADNTYNIT
jgi:hypothetical protein